MMDKLEDRMNNTSDNIVVGSKTNKPESLTLSQDVALLKYEINNLKGNVNKDEENIYRLLKDFDVMQNIRNKNREDSDKVTRTFNSDGCIIYTT